MWLFTSVHCACIKPATMLFSSESDHAIKMLWQTKLDIYMELKMNATKQAEIIRLPEETDPQDSWHLKGSELGSHQWTATGQWWKRLELMWLHREYNLNIICENFSFLTFCIWMSMLKFSEFQNRITADNWTALCVKLKRALSITVWGWH